MLFKTSGKQGATILLLGEFPSIEMVQSGTAWSGTQGRLLDQMLKKADIFRYDCLLSFVGRERPPGGDYRFFFKDTKSLEPKPILEKWLGELRCDLQKYKPNVVVTLGAFALWAMTGQWKLADYRGSLMESSLFPGMKVLPTESPYTIQRMWELTFPVMMDFRKAKRQSSFYGLPVDNRVHVEDANISEFLDYCAFLCDSSEVEYIAADVETSKPNNHINRIGYAHSPDFGLSFPLLNGTMPLLNENDELRAWQAINNVAHCNKKIVYQNAAYDLSVLLTNNNILHTNLYMDTMVAAHVLWPEAKRSLGFLASICLDIPAWKHTSQENAGLYNAQDCTSTLGIALVVEEEMKKAGVRGTFDMEMRQVPLAIYLQLQGIKISTNTQSVLLQEATEKKKGFLAQLDVLTDGGINYNSPTQLQDLLYMRMGLPVQYKRRKRASDVRKVTTDAEALNKLYRDSKHPVLKLILDYRKWEKLRKNVSYVPSSANRYHTSYNICSKTSKKGGKIFLNEDEGGTDTGRWSSSGSIIFSYGPGNLQNINYWARRMYVPDSGKVLIQADYIQAEAVVVAYLTNDQNLKRIFRDKEDLHCYTAAMMFSLPLESIGKDSEERKIGKMLRHATNYSAGPAVVAKGIGIKITEAKRLLDLYKSINPLLANWHNRIQEELNRTRTLTTPLGRKRRFLDRWGDDLFRSAYAFLPQSTVGDLLNISMTDLYEDEECVGKIDIMMQLHDAIYIQVDNNINAIKYGISKLKQHMTKEIIINDDAMIIGVDFTVGYNWGEMDTARIEYNELQVLTNHGEEKEKVWEAFTCQTEN